MKKYIVLLIALMVGIFATAQTVTFPALDTETTYTYVGTDYSFTNSTARVFVFPTRSHYQTMQDYVIKLDSVSGNHTSVTVVLAGSKSLIKNTWTTIGTVVWTTVPVPSADTTIIISNATANQYRYFRATITGAGTGVSKVSDQEFKLWRP